MFPSHNFFPNRHGACRQIVDGYRHCGETEFAPMHILPELQLEQQEEPQEGQIVFVAGGVAQYRNGVFYTGMEDPRWTRPIKWGVDWWYPIDKDPRAKD